MWPCGSLAAPLTPRAKLVNRPIGFCFVEIAHENLQTHTHTHDFRSQPQLLVLTLKQSGSLDFRHLAAHFCSHSVDPTWFEEHISFQTNVSGVARLATHFLHCLWPWPTSCGGFFGTVAEFTSKWLPPHPDFETPCTEFYWKKTRL